MWGGTPQRNMASSMTNLPSSWDVAAMTNIKWKAALGDQSYGNPVVAGGKVFVGTNNQNPRNPAITGDKGVLMCFSEADGKFLWQAVTDKLASGEVNDWPEVGVCSSPAVEGNRLYYVTNRGELVCLDTEGFMDGKNDGPYQDEVHKGPTDADIVWKLDMMKELGVFQHNMASSSPIVWGNLVFLETSNGRDASHENIPAPEAPSFIAVDKNTGKVVWQDNSPGDRILHGQWSSPALGEVDGVMQVFFPGGDGWLYGFNALTGQRLWKFDLNPKDAVWPKTRNDAIAAPVFHGGRVYIATGHDPEQGEGVGHLYSIDPRGKSGDITELRARLALHQDPPIHLHRRDRGRAGLHLGFQRLPALPGPRDRKALLDVRRACRRVGVGPGRGRKGLPGGRGRRRHRAAGGKRDEEDRRDEHGHIGLQHAGPRERRALHHDPQHTLSPSQEKNGDRRGLTRSEFSS